MSKNRKDSSRRVRTFKADNSLELIKSQIGLYFDVPSFELVCLRNEIDKLDEIFERLNENFRKNKEERELILKSILAKELLINESWGFLHKYLEVHNRKVQMSLRSIETNQNQINGQLIELQHLRRELNVLQQAKARLQKRVEQFRVVKIYLESVTTLNPEEFPSVQGIIGQFAFHSNLRKEFQLRNYRAIEQLSETTKDLFGTTQATTMELVAISNKVNDALNDKETLEAKAKTLENKLFDIKNTNLERAAHRIKIESGLNNFYLQVSQRLGLKSKGKIDDPSQQSVLLSSALVDLADMHGRLFKGLDGNSSIDGEGTSRK